MFSTLNTIISDITKIRRQNRMVTTIFSSLNKGKVDGCVGRLTVALDKFKVNISYLLSTHGLPVT